MEKNQGLFPAVLFVIHVHPVDLGQMASGRQLL
jgi:hypothetical protein